MLAAVIAISFNGPEIFGIGGAVLFGVTVVALVIFALSTGGPGEREEWRVGDRRVVPLTPAPFRAKQPEDEKEERKVKDIKEMKVFILLLVFVTQLICFGILVVSGGQAVVEGGVGDACVERVAEVEVVGCVEGCNGTRSTGIIITGVRISTVSMSMESLTSSTTMTNAIIQPVTSERARLSFSSVEGGSNIATVVVTQSTTTIVEVTV